MAPFFSVVIRKSGAALDLLFAATRNNGNWKYVGDDLIKKAQNEFPLELYQMAAKINGKTFLLQRSLKPLAFPIGNSNKFKFKLTQFGVPIADISSTEESNSEKQDLVIELVDRGKQIIQI